MTYGPTRQGENGVVNWKRSSHGKKKKDTENP